MPERCENKGKAKFSLLTECIIFFKKHADGSGLLLWVCFLFVCFFVFVFCFVKLKQYSVHVKGCTFLLQESEKENIVLVTIFDIYFLVRFFMRKRRCWELMILFHKDTQRVIFFRQKLIYGVRVV